jgi:hypothetical protein
MRNGTFLPALAACIAVVFLAASSSPIEGQGQITDESTPGIQIKTEDSTPVTVKPQQPPATPAPRPVPAPGLTALPTNAQDINALIAEMSRLEANADTILANQQKIDEALTKLEETIEQARIYASRAGSRPAAP